MECVSDRKTSTPPHADGLVCYAALKPLVTAALIRTRKARQTRGALVPTPQRLLSAGKARSSTLLR